MNTGELWWNVQKHHNYHLPQRIFEPFIKNKLNGAGNSSPTPLKYVLCFQIIQSILRSFEHFEVIRQIFTLLSLDERFQL